MKWQSIKTAPRDGRLLRLKRVYKGKLVTEGIGCFAYYHATAPMMQPLGPDPLGRYPYDYKKEMAEIAERARTPQWLKADRMYKFPEPTHWKPE